jgi:hypothetical protein
VVTDALLMIVVVGVILLAAGVDVVVVIGWVRGRWR